MGRLDARVGRLRQQAGALDTAVRDLMWARCGQGRDYSSALDALAKDVQRAWAIGIEEMARTVRQESGASSQVAHLLATRLHRDARWWRSLYALDGGVTLTAELERLPDAAATLGVVDPTTIAAIIAWCQHDAPDVDADAEGPDAA